MDLYGTVNDSHQLIFNKATNELKSSFVQSCKPGQVVRVTLTKTRADKTYQQVKAVWGLIIPITKRALDDAGVDCMGVALSKDMVKSILYRFCGAVGDDGEIVPMSSQTVDQASKFFENARQWLASTFNVNVPDPDPEWRAKDGITDDGTDDGNTDVASRGTDAPPFALDASHRWVCDKCGCGYRVKPARGKCIDKDEDGFPCGGKVVQR